MSYVSVEHAHFRRSPHRRELAPFPLNWTRTISVWIERRRQRQALIELDDRLLADIGLSIQQACHEAAKPFWKR
jgi:uncharacterized protein YjiS (DUF1127 family)